MSDPLWDELDKSLPRIKRGEQGWAHQRAKILSAARGQRAPQRLAAGLAGGLVLAALTFAVIRRPAVVETPAVSVPADDLDMLESESMLDHLDELLDATELDRA